MSSRCVLTAASSPSRPHRVPGHDGGSLPLGRPGGSAGPTTVSTHLALRQQCLRLFLIFRPGLRHVPLLPPPFWGWVSVYLRRLRRKGLCLGHGRISRPQPGARCTSSKAGDGWIPLSPGRRQARCPLSRTCPLPGRVPFHAEPASMKRPSRSQPHLWAPGDPQVVPFPESTHFLHLTADLANTHRCQISKAVSRAPDTGPSNCIYFLLSPSSPLSAHLFFVWGALFPFSVIISPRLHLPDSMFVPSLSLRPALPLPRVPRMGAWCLAVSV